MQTSFQEFSKSARLVTNLGLGALSAVSGYFTYLGVAIMFGSPGGFSLNALVYALGVTALVYVYWSYVLYIVPRMVTSGTRAFGLFVIVSWGLIIIALSSWMNVMALAGNGAQDALLRDMASQANVALREASGRTSDLDGIRDELAMTAARYDALAQSEIQRGALTGAAGRGRVSESLLASKAAIDGLLAEIDANALERSKAFKAGIESLKLLDAIIDDDLARSQQNRLFKEEMEKLARSIDALSVNGDAKAITRVMRALSGQTGLFAGSGNQALAATQADVIGRISSELEATGERIAGAADQIAGIEAIKAPTFKRLGIERAVVIYAADLVPYWAGGIGMDIMPVALVLLLMLLFETSRRQDPVDPEIADMPFGVVQKLFFELERMRQVSDQEALAPYREQAHRPAAPQITGDTQITPVPEDHDKAKPPWSDDDAKDWSRFTGQ
ncbi:hypothetical protein GH722_04855 [Alphaproteobacteria bacterium HT1-32]|nr:hypothetical protein [Alphaproteobacteria bacterium HT1-32]